ncbi:MAG: hypothetical protein ACM3JI_03195, partial [Anaerolineae bacterium]
YAPETEKSSFRLEFAQTVKEALEKNKEGIVNFPELSDQLLTQAIFFKDLATFELLLDNGVKHDYRTWSLVLPMPERELDPLLLQMRDLLGKHSKSPSSKIMSSLELQICVKRAIAQEADIEILEKLKGFGMKATSHSSNYRKFEDDHKTAAFNQALEHGLKTSDFRILTLAIALGAIPGSKSYEILKDCKDPTILKLIKETDPYQRFDKLYLKTLFEEFGPSSPTQEVERLQQHLNALIEEGVVSKETLEAFIVEGMIKFHPRNIEKFVELKIIDIHTAVTFMINVFGLSRFLRAVDAGRWDDIFSEEFSSKCLLDETMIENIQNRRKVSQLDHRVFSSLVFKRMLSL